MTLGDQIQEKIREGHYVVQSGRVDKPPEQGLAFADRVSGCNVSLIRSGDVLLENTVRWVHMQKTNKRKEQDHG